MADATGGERIYRISPSRQWLATGSMLGPAAALLVIGAVTLRSDPGFGRAMLLTGLILSGLAVAMFLLLRYTRLALREDGLSLYQVGYTLETGWSNLKCLDQSSGAEGIVLHRPMEGRGARMLRRFKDTRLGPGIRMFSEEQAALLAERRFIPLEAFVYGAQRGRLRDELHRHAPQLVTQTGAPPPG